MPECPRCNLFHDFINKLPKGKKSRGRTALVNTSFLLEGNIPDESGINAKGNFEIGRTLHLSRGAATFV